MNVFHSQSQLTQHLNPLRLLGKSIGFVPTMGAIHLGHLSLLEQALKENQVVVISIFVNPTQFNNSEDLEKYPRTLERDTEQIQRLSDQIIIYAPDVDDIYEGNTVAQRFNYDGLEMEMEGANRPGHFDGVGTIVKKLFEIVKPVRAYFGEKDFQQLLIVRKMVHKNKMDVQVIGCPVFREENGLAMSSRNERLSEAGRQKAAFIYKVLTEAKNRFQHSDLSEVLLFVSTSFANDPYFTLEYFIIADEDSLESATKKEEGKKYRGFIVVHLENVRLIDNIAFN
ncbi:MAG TPA: pantoate--beta-alanine ligase [Flavobacterium sp.]|nr:pantoate--beta-alanine ligase [Flavobacterium sp.]